MNRYLNDRRIREFLRRDGLFAVVAVALVVFLFVYWRQGGVTREERGTIQKQLTLARGDLASLRGGSEKSTLQVERERLKFAAPASLPPLSNALDFGTAVTDYAAHQKLKVDAMDVASTSVDAGGVSQPAVSYSLKAAGPLPSLVGILTLPDRFPTATVQTLEFTHPPDAGDEWSIVISVVVVHSGS